MGTSARSYGSNPQADVFILTKERPVANLPKNTAVQCVTAYRVGGQDDDLIVLVLDKGRFAVPPLPAKFSVKLVDGALPSVAGEFHGKAGFDNAAIIVTVATGNVVDME